MGEEEDALKKDETRLETNPGMKQTRRGLVKRRSGLARRGHVVLGYGGRMNESLDVVSQTWPLSQETGSWNL